MDSEQVIVGYEVQDVRFPTSRLLDGSDSIHVDPDYSLAYLTLTTEGGARGYGMTFTLGAGTDIVVATVRLLKGKVLGRSVREIFGDYRTFYRSVTQDSQMRWLGPEKGIVHLAAAALFNGLWDLAARLAGKPLWRLVVETPPNRLVSMIDWSYLGDVITESEALGMLTVPEEERRRRISFLEESGYPAYITSVGWLGYPDEKVQALTEEKLAEGWTAFKMKVGTNREDDERRGALMRRLIGPRNLLMMDANQIWDVPTAISRMEGLAPFRPLWIEEPTSPDDILGHAAISTALASSGVGVATGEMAQNRVIFKQLLQSGGMQFCQIDSCRVAGVTEILAIMILAHKFGVPVVPHAGGVGLCELVRHYSIVDYVLVSGSVEGRMCEYADHLHEHFTDPALVIAGRYVLPGLPGFSSRLTEAAVTEYSFPEGGYWSRDKE